MALRRPTIAEVNRAYAAAEAELQELRRRPDRDAEREGVLLAAMDALEAEAGRIERETPGEERGITRGG